MDVCLNCQQEFAKRSGKGYQKSNLNRKIRLSGADSNKNITAYNALQELFSYKGPSEGYICDLCFSRADKSYRAHLNIQSSQGKRKTIASSPVETPIKKAKVVTPTRRCHKRHKIKSKKKTKLINSVGKCLERSQYESAFRAILGTGSAAKAAFDKVVSRMVRKQMMTYVKETNFPILNGMNSVAEFCWSALLETMQSGLPTLFASIQGAMSRKESARKLVPQRIGLMMTVPLYTMNPLKFKFFQAVCGVQMWKCGASDKLFKCLNRLGICQSKSASRKLIDELCKECDSEIKLALASFYDNDGGDEMEDEPAASPPVTDKPSPPQAAEAKPDHKKTSVPSRFATIGSMQHAGDSDSDEEQEAFYAGGSEQGGGQQILGPKKKKEAPQKIVENLFKAAREHGAEEVGAGPSAQHAEQGSRFGGTGYRLGEVEGPSAAIAGHQVQQPRQVDMVLKLWKNGFSVDDGPLREFTDEKNRAFLERIKQGEVPQELIKEARGGEVNLNMEDHREEEYVKPKKPIKAFSGEGNKLGSPAPNVVSTPSAATSQPAPPSVSVDSTQPVTNVQIRLLDGSRLVAKFNHSHTVQDVRSYILSSRPQFSGTNFLLMTTFPNKELTDETQTLTAANLLNAVLVQKAK